MAEPRWTPERVAALRTLWTQGLSAAEVARRLGGVTRNAVIGKVWRLRLSGGRPPGPPRPVRVARSPRRRRSRGVRRVGPGPLEAQPAWTPGSGLVADLLDLRPGDCRWPVGDPREPGFAFCGRPAERGPYCGGHGRLAVSEAGDVAG